jgi:ABC-type phosphate transport system substrate-binding protein
VKHFRTIAVAGFLAATVLPAAAMDISGAGATFPYPIYAKWADAYKKETGVGLRRRHQTNRSPDCHFRRHRCAAQG